MKPSQQAQQVQFINGSIVLITHPFQAQRGQSFTATANGSYAVIVTQNGCFDTSNCQAISSVGITESDIKIFSVYTNPANGELTLDLGNVQAEEVSVTDVLGNTVIAFKPTGQIVRFSLEGYANGIYFVRIIVQGEMKMVRISKQ
ncbi:MAG: T9SS type A sorting domain-containing protein [Bacteroidia bacterium]